MSCVEEYLSSLQDLTGNDAPRINVLTILAEENYDNAPNIAFTIETHLKSLPSGKLPVLYLIDSIVKNVGKNYVNLFARNLPAIFAKVFAESTELKVRSCLFKLRSTWDGVFSKEMLTTLDRLVYEIDANWPVKSNIHLNPLFMKGAQPRTSVVRENMKEKILEKEILELEKRKVELELRRTKEVLEMEQKKLESFTKNINMGHLTVEPSKVLRDKASSSSLKRIESDNTKKLLEVSIRDPRKKARQGNLIGAASPLPSSPPTKEKKRHRDRERDADERVHKKPYSSRTKREDNGDGHLTDNLLQTRLLNESRRSSRLLSESKTSEPVRTPPLPETNSSAAVTRPTRTETKALESVKAHSQTQPPPSNKPSLPTVSLQSKDANCLPTGVTLSVLHKTRDPRLTVDYVKPVEEVPLPPSEPVLDELPPPVIPTEASPARVVEVPFEPKPSTKEIDVQLPVDNDLKSESSSTKDVTTKSLVDKETFENVSHDKELSSEKTVDQAPKVEEIKILEDSGPPDNQEQLTPSRASKRKLDEDEDDETLKRRLIENMKGRDESPVPPPPPSIPPLGDMNTRVQEPLVDNILMASEESGKDVDLRLLLPRPLEKQVVEEEKVERGTTELDPMDLFGGEDVDYRQKPPQPDFSMPSPPPPPVISNTPDSPSKKSWAQIKDRKSEERTPKTKPDRTKRPSVSRGRKENSCQEPEVHCQELIKDLEEQLRNGNITFIEYNKMLQEVPAIHEERILKKAKARYSETPNRSPIEESPERDDDRDREISDVEHRWVEERVGRPPEIMQPQEVMRPDRFIMGMLPPPHIVENFPQRPPHPIRPPQLFNPPNSMPFQMEVRPRMHRNLPSTLLPQADADMLLDADRERFESIPIGDQVRQVRFYGLTAVVLVSWDDPREVRFPVEQRYLFVDKRHEFPLRFGDPPKDITIDNITSLVHLGAPTRELYIDGKSIRIQFGGRPIEVPLCGRLRSVCISGPPPIVEFGPIKRTDLVAGSVTLYVDAKTNFQIFLDSKPQTFSIKGEPCILQFADALCTVLINGVAVPLEFGGYPVPVMLRGVVHFLRLTCLPHGVIPGQIPHFPHQPPMVPPALVKSNPQIFMPPAGVVPPLPNMMNPPPQVPPPTEMAYSVEPPASPPHEEPPPAKVEEAPANLNINDLFQKLIQIGILQNSTPPPVTVPTPPVVERPDFRVPPPETDADFTRPESLKSARPGLITKLYSGIQCSSCGIRFPPEGTKMYSRHLDWHFRQNKREKHSTKKPQCRGWYYDVGNWMQYQEVEDPEEAEQPEEEKEEEEEEVPCVPVGRSKDAACSVCRERFEEFFCHETEEWQARNALLVDEKFYHPVCHQELEKKKEMEPIVEEEEDVGPPYEDATIECIDLDDTDVPSPASTVGGETLPLLGPESPEVIALDDEEETKKVVPVEEKEEKVEEKEEEVESDDDIIAIIPIERKFETVELLGEEDAESGGEAVPAPEEILEGSGEEEEEEAFDFTKVKVKQEKDRVNLDSVDSSLPTYTATIDGNIVHETTASVVLPKRIKINIHRSVAPSGDSGGESNDAIALSQPPPPGEDPPASPLKPNLVGVELSPQPPVDSGLELSGLCSIM